MSNANSSQEADTTFQLRVEHWNLTRWFNLHYLLLNPKTNTLAILLPIYLTLTSSDTSTWFSSQTGTTMWTWLELYTRPMATSTLARLTSTPGRKSFKHNHLPQLVQPARHHRHPPCILAGDKASPTMAGPPKVLILAYLIIYPRLFWHKCCMRVCNVYIFSFLVLAPFSLSY